LIPPGSTSRLGIQVRFLSIDHRIYRAHTFNLQLLSNNTTTFLVLILLTTMMTTIPATIPAKEAPVHQLNTPFPILPAENQILFRTDAEPAAEPS
jgi:hypothetical protein